MSQHTKTVKLHTLETKNMRYSFPTGVACFTLVRLAVPGGWIYFPDSKQPLFLPDPKLIVEEN